MALSGTTDLEGLARKHGLNPGTVRTWDKRGAIPEGKLAEFAAQYGVEVAALTQAVVAEPPPAYRSSGQIEGDSFSKRLATAMNIVDAGLAAECVDINQVPRAEMAAAVFRLLPWPIPKTPTPGGRKAD